MSSVSDAIGNRFEEIFLAQFPEFVKTDKNGRGSGNWPDFSNGLFRIEAKTGFREYGVRTKQKQIYSFQRFQEPVIYAIGYHNFEKARIRIGRKTEIQMAKILREEMRIDLAYFVTSGVIARIWDSEFTVAKKTKEAYCMLKWRFLRNIIDNSSFKREGVEYIADEYYGLDYSSYLMLPPKVEVFGAPCGFILDKNKDKKVIDYFQRKNLINPSHHN